MTGYGVVFSPGLRIHDRRSRGFLKSDFKMPRRRRKRKRQKSNWLNKQNNNVTLFCTFLCSHSRTTTGKCLISRFMGDVNKRQLNFLPLSEFEYGSKEFGSKRVRLHLTKLMSWSYRDRDWKNANSLSKRRFRGRRSRSIFNSLLSLIWPPGRPLSCWSLRTKYFASLPSNLPCAHSSHQIWKQYPHNGTGSLGCRLRVFKPGLYGNFKIAFKANTICIIFN